MSFIWNAKLKEYFSRFTIKAKPTWSATVADEDINADIIHSGRRFSVGSRPVIRWIKGDGLDDEVTRAALGQATRLFGSEVDYCLCTQGIDVARARHILEWATQPVEWWPITEEDNPELADLLKTAGCEPENFGYWWKWFPERVRPDAPEWILDGDMVITGKPDWFQQWLNGSDHIRLSQVDNESPVIYGKYASLVDTKLMLYSGLASIPPKCRYFPYISKVLVEQPLASGHNGKKDMDEQGVIVAAFEKLDAQPIPLFEFPFCRAFQDYVDYGLHGEKGEVWGYHFGHSFVRRNLHFERLTNEKIIFSKAESGLIEQFQWLGSHGQWGVPGWTMPDGCVEIILDLAAGFKGKSVLELGTSRGRLSAMLATMGCNVTTIDRLDRGAGKNLQGLSVNVVVDDAKNFLETSSQYFDLIICDLHGNSPADWKRFSKILINKALSGSTLIISNALLYKIPEWKDETGVQWFLKQLPKHWHIKLFSQALPGVVMVTPKSKNEKVRFSSIVVTWFLIMRQVVKFKVLKYSLIRIILMAKFRIISYHNLFDEKFYLQNNPDVKASRIHPLKHYLFHGGFEGRNPSEKFDSAFYLEQYPDVMRSGMNPLVHYLRFGKVEGRNVLP